MMRTKRTTAAAATAAAALMLAACSGGGSSAEEGETGANGPSGDITLWMYPIMSEDDQAAYWDGVEAAFTEEYPDINLDVQFQPWSGRAEALSAAVAAGNQPDLIYLNPDYIAQYGEMGALDPLQDRLDPEVLDAFNETSVAGASYDGNLYALPVLQSVNTTLWNKNVLDAAGIEEPPETWDELLEVAPDIKEAGYYVTMYMGSLETTLLASYYPFLWQAGGSVFSEDGESVAVNDDAGVEALTYIKTLVDEEYVPREPLLSAVPLEQSAWATGEVAFISHQPASVAAEFVPEEDILVAPPLTGAETVGHGTIGGLAAMSGSDSPEAVDALLEFLVQPENLEELLTKSGFYSPTTALSGIYPEGSLNSQEEQLLEFMNAGPMHTAARDALDVLTPRIQDVLLNDADPQEQLDAAADELQDVIDRG